MYKYLEVNKLLSPVQFGFRSRRCTSQAALRLTEHIRGNMDIGNLTGAVYIDLRRAFDTVNHGCLLAKLPHYGIANNELKWFEDYLFGRSQFVQYNSVNSEVESVTCGVPQGSILGPLLFVVFINDLDTVLKKTNLILYADDTVVYYSGKTSEEIIKILNDDLQELGKWFKENNLVINMKKGKTEFVLYGTAKRISMQQLSGEQSVTICGENVNQSTSYDYLGVTLDDKLTFTEYLQKLYKKGSTRLKLLSTVRESISPYVAETIYCAMIEPVLMYCSAVLLGDERQCCHKLQNLQERANKIVFGKKARNTWIPLKNRREIDAAIVIFKCLHDLSPLTSCFGFSLLNHGKNTRGNGLNLVLPKVKTQSGKKTFAFQGVKLYNN